MKSEHQINDYKPPTSLTEGNATNSSGCTDRLVENNEYDCYDGDFEYYSRDQYERHMGKAHTKNTVCKFWWNGWCKKGDFCTFNHSETPACKFQENCHFWPNCKFSHDNFLGPGRRYPDVPPINSLLDFPPLPPQNVWRLW